MTDNATKSFAELYSESLKKMKMRPGDILEGTVEKVDEQKGIVFISCPYIKSDGVIPLEQFTDSEGKIEVNVGEVVDVVLEAFEDGFGETILSREKAKRAESWKEIEKAYEENQTLFGVITGRVKGGFTVEINKVRAFLPGSLVDVRPVRDPSFLEGKDLEFKVIKVDRKRNNIVVSRRAVVEAESSAEREELLSNLQEGQVVKGIIKNLTDYGAFVDLGGIDGLLHITDMSWKRIKHPSELLTIGNEIEVKVLKFDKDKNRVSLGLKQLGSDPWINIQERYPVNTRLRGKVMNLTDYGCFVELEEGVEGLVHVSEMDWTNKNVNPKKVVHLGEEIEVLVLEIDESKRRISLGIKQCKDNPWLAFANKYKEGEKLSGKIKSITDFGIFIGLEGNIDGLVHMSDISWTASGEEAIRTYQKGQEIETVILAIDAERERISLGIKQLEDDPVANFLNEHPKSSMVTGRAKEVTAKKAIIELSDAVDGVLLLAEYSQEQATDLREHLKENDSVDVTILGTDSKSRMVSLSMKARNVSEDSHDQEQREKSAATEQPVSTTLGDLLKEKIENKQNNED